MRRTNSPVMMELPMATARQRNEVAMVMNLQEVSFGGRFKKK